MFTDATLTQIANVFSLDAAKFIVDYKSDKEVALEVPVLHSQEKMTDFGKNSRTEGFQSGKLAMEEILVKELKKKHTDIVYDGKKLDVFISKFQDYIKSKADIKPDERIKTLEKEKSDLQLLIETQKGTHQTELGTLNSKINGFQISKSLMGAIPKDKKLSLDGSDAIDLFMLNYSVSKDEEGNTVVSKDGQPLKDDVKNLIPLEKVFNTFLEDKKLFSIDGMGGKNRKGEGSTVEKFDSMQEYIQYCADEKIDPSSNENLELLNKKKTFD